MYGAIILITVIMTAQVAFGQAANSITITVRNKDTSEAVAEATVTVKDSDISGKTNAAGEATLSNIPDGPQTIEVFSPGYETTELAMTFPTSESTPRIVLLELHNEVGSVTIESTRTGREIAVPVVKRLNSGPLNDAPGTM